MYIGQDGIISKPSYYYDTIIHHYDKCHKGKQGVSYSHYDNIITLLSHYYDTIIISMIASIMTQQTIMTHVQTAVFYLNMGKW